MRALPLSRSQMALQYSTKTRWSSRGVLAQLSCRRLVFDGPNHHLECRPLSSTCTSSCSEERWRPDADKFRQRDAVEPNRRRVHTHKLSCLAFAVRYAGKRGPWMRPQSPEATPGVAAAGILLDLKTWVDSGLFSRRSFVRNGQFFCFAVLKQKNARCWPPRPGHRPDDGARRTIIPGLGGSWRLNGRGPAGVRRRPERSQRLLAERSRVCGLSHTATLQGIMARCRNRDCTRRHFNNMKRL